MLASEDMDPVELPSAKLLEAGLALASELSLATVLQRTSHGSTLSGMVHSWVLARADRARSWRFFKRTLESDLRDTQRGTTTEGIHLGAMAGTVDMIQRGYTGLELREDVLWLNPQLPDELGGLEFDIRYRGHWGVRITVDHRRLEVSLRRAAAAAVRVGYRDSIVEIQPGGTWSTELPP